MADKRIDQLGTILASALTGGGTMWLPIGRNAASAQRLDISFLLGRIATSQTNYTVAGPHALTTSATTHTNLGSAVAIGFTLWVPVVGDWVRFIRMPSAPYAMTITPNAANYIGDGGIGKYVEMMGSGALILRCYEVTRWAIDEGTNASLEYEF